MTELSIDWEFKRLADCLEILKSGKLAERGWSPQCLSHPVSTQDTWGVLKTTSVQMGEYQAQHNKELPKSLLPKIGLEVEPGDFLVTTTGPRNRCGIVCQVKSTPKMLIFSGKMVRFRVDEKIIKASWLLFLLMSPDCQKTLDEMKVGTSDSSVSIGNQQILDLLVPVPSIQIQESIVADLEKHFSRIEAADRLVKEIQSQSISLKRSLLHNAFSSYKSSGENDV
jgi:type I restriction enzyme S subunit